MRVVDDQGNPIPEQQSKRVLAGILAIVFGELGIHKFVLGYTAEGLIQIALTIVTCGIAGIIGIIEGIIYLTKTDEEFIYQYQTNKRSWF